MRPVYIVLVILLLLVPLIIRDDYLMHLIIMTCVWGIVATNWNLTLGYGGMFHIAQLTFFAVGGYASGIGAVTFGASPWLGLLIGGAAAMAASLVIGLPSLRVKGIYLILLTYAFHNGVSELVNHFRDYTGGSMGLLVPAFEAGSVSFVTHPSYYYYMVLPLLLFSIISTRLIEKSFIGKALMATRDSEVLASVSGINPYKYKLVTFITAAFISGIAGAFYASYLGVIGPEIFSFSLIVNGLGMIVIGGMGTLFGPIAGSFIITFFMEVFSSLEDFRPILVGAVIILALLYAPNGVVNYLGEMLAKIKSRKLPGQARESGE
jgi:branched-chain amino acid transport system permease protein